jgi:hypothetical protein
MSPLDNNVILVQCTAWTYMHAAIPLVQNYFWNSWRLQDTRPDVEGPRCVLYYWLLLGLKIWFGLLAVKMSAAVSGLHSHDHWRRFTCCCISSRLPSKQTCELCPSTRAWLNDCCHVHDQMTDSVSHTQQSFSCVSHMMILFPLAQGTVRVSCIVFSCWDVIVSLFSLSFFTKKMWGEVEVCGLLSWRPVCRYSHHSWNHDLRCAAQLLNMSLFRLVGTG